MFKRKIEKLSEAVIGFRAWSAGDDGTLYSLCGYPIYQMGKPCPAGIGLGKARTQWPALEPLDAGQCNSGPAPVRGCICGIYAHRKIWLSPAQWHIVRHFGGEDCLGVRYIVGAVHLWGRIIEHETGYRAQYARPLALMDWNKISGLLPSVARLYDIPILSRGEIRSLEPPLQPKH